MKSIKRTAMEIKEQTISQIERALKKVANKLELNVTEQKPLTDILIQVKQESGELMVFNDDDEELTRCVIEEWIENKDEDFYLQIQSVLKQAITNLKEKMENLPILKPYSFVLIGEDKETINDLYLVDDDTIMLDGDLLKGLDKDLDEFLNHLLKD